MLKGRCKAKYVKFVFNSFVLHLPFNKLLLVAHPFQKRFFLLIMLQWRFTKIFCEISRKNFQGNATVASLSLLSLGHNKEAIILYPYFICECIEPFLSKPFTLFWIILIINASYTLIYYCPIVGNHSDIRKYRFHAKYIAKNLS